MGIKGWLGRVLGFSADPPPRPIAEVLLEMAGRGLLPRVGRSEAISVPAVLRARNLICSPATLPLRQLDAARNVVRLPLLEQIDPDVANVVTLAQTLEDLLFEGISWWRIIDWDYSDYPVYAQHVDLANVSLQPPGAPSPSPLPSGQDPRQAVVYMYGEPVPASRVIRFDSPNPGLLTAGGRAIRRAVLLDTTSALYADNPRPLDYFTPNEDADPADDATVAEILAMWNRARKERSTAYIPAALTYNSVDTPTPAELQLIELQRKATLDIANATGLDPEDLGISTTSRTYQNGVDRRQDRINDVFSPYMAAITDRLTMPDVTRRGYTVGFDLDAYLRADPLTRAKVYQAAGVTQWMDDTEARKEEGLPAFTAAQRAAIAPPPAPAATAGNVIPINRPRAANMAGDAEEGLAFAIDVQPLANVDVERRIIEGIVVPYGPDKIAWKGGKRWRFQQGSLVVPAELHRNKALRDHDNSQPLGKLIYNEDRPSGMFAKYKIAEGPDGDRALAEAADQIRDGWSVGVEIIDAGPDPLNQGVFLVAVAGATWRESSLLAVPAFDDARVTRVAAGADQGEVMTAPVDTNAPDTGATPETQPESPAVQLSNDQLKGLVGNPALLRALMGVPAPAAPTQEQAQFALNEAQVTALLATPGGREALLGLPAPEQRTTVDPTRRTFSGAVEVREQPAYRFDRKGNLTAGKFDFSSDVIAGLRDRDAEALERAQNFVREQFADKMNAQFATAMTDVATINPNINRPDLYVDQQEFEYPIWNTINKGTIADATPFVLPKFNTSSGLVAAHVENTEPTPGVFTATAQTITPSAVSGKVEISREAWDQGGNPQLSGLIWRQMTRAWFEALEASAVALLEASAPTTITITTAAVNAALEASLTSQLAPLQYIRGGFRMRDFFIQVDLYKALIGAVDTAGRKLFPYLGAQNASGTTNDFFASVLVAGLVGRPAWALAATSANSANSFLFDSGDVSGWATAPMRLTFDNIAVAKVHVGIWGYKALAITDLTGLRKVAYDPV